MSVSVQYCLCCRCCGYVNWRWVARYCRVETEAERIGKRASCSSVAPDFCKSPWLLVFQLVVWPPSFRFLRLYCRLPDAALFSSLYVDADGSVHVFYTCCYWCRLSSIPPPHHSVLSFPTFSSGSSRLMLIACEQAEKAHI